MRQKLHQMAKDKAGKVLQANVVALNPSSVFSLVYRLPHWFLRLGKKLCGGSSWASKLPFGIWRTKAQRGVDSGVYLSDDNSREIEVYGGACLFSSASFANFIHVDKHCTTLKKWHLKR